ncbi:MAG: GDSL-type esterase/lipase family protein [Oscillospiraceae bacterium]|nr:GDSL-type esterase/lipase family protein [Oscillospiraceae bacterium]
MLKYLLCAAVLAAALVYAVLRRRGILPRSRFYGSGGRTLVCAGDGQTLGVGVKNRCRRSYPAVLASLLGDEWRVGSFGSAGCTTAWSRRPYIASRACRRSFCASPAAVVLMLGTNDSREDNWHGGGEFYSALLSLAQAYIGLPSAPRVIVVTPPCVFAPERGSARDTAPRAAETEQIAAAALRAGLDAGASVIDFHTISSARRDWFDRTGCRLNAEGAAALAKIIFASGALDEV